MDIIVCTSKSRLLAQAMAPLCEAFAQSGARLRWVQSLGSMAPETAECVADFVIVTQDADPARVRQLFGGVRKIEIGLDGLRDLPGVMRRATLRAPALRLDLFPRALFRNTGGQGALIPMASPPTGEGPLSAPVWLHAMPKDVETLLLCPGQTPGAFGSIWARARSERPCNVICLSPPLPEQQAANVYFKPQSDLDHALGFAQLAVVAEDEVLAWRCVQRGVPVVFASDRARSDFGFSLERLGLGLSVPLRDVESGVARVLANPRYRAHAMIYRAQLLQARPLADWVEHLLNQPSPHKAPRGPRSFRPLEAF